MPHPGVLFHKEAADEYRIARDWYAARSPEVAERFRNAVDHAVLRLTNDFDTLPRVLGRYRWT